MTEIPAILIAALIMVESGGRAHPPRGRDGEVGPLQIRAVVVDDLRRLGHQFTYEDRHDRAKSEEMCRLYLGHYATAERLGREPTLEDMARIWNGGPRGYRKVSTKAYWRKVRVRLPP